MNYPFNTGDLLCCGQCASNYLDTSTKVPWEDLRYMFGEIIYGGHVVEDWDRRLAAAYLTKLMNDNLLENFEIFPNFMAPPSSCNIQQVDYRPLSYKVHSCRTIVKPFLCVHCARHTTQS